jgi:hypothetical protein
MIGRIPHIVSLVRSRVWHYVPLHGILSSIEGGWGACAVHEVGSAFKFLIDFVLRYNVKVVQSIETVGVPFIVVDANDFTL